MKKIYFILILYFLISTCNSSKTELVPHQIVLVNLDFFSLQNEDVSNLKFIRNDAPFGSTQSNFISDSIELTSSNFVDENELFEEQGCVISLHPIIQNHHLLWTYSLCKFEFSEIDTLIFKFKPKVNLALNIITQKDLDSFSCRIEHFYDKYNSEFSKTNFLITEYVHQSPNSINNNPLINLPIIQEEKLNLIVRYKEDGNSVEELEFQIETDSSFNFEMVIEI